MLLSKNAELCHADPKFVYFELMQIYEVFLATVNNVNILRYSCKLAEIFVR
jgi:hypothetical protein